MYNCHKILNKILWIMLSFHSSLIQSELIVADHPNLLYHVNWNRCSSRQVKWSPMDPPAVTPLSPVFLFGNSELHVERLEISWYSWNSDFLIFTIYRGTTSAAYNSKEKHVSVLEHMGWGMATWTEHMRYTILLYEVLTTWWNKWGKIMAGQ